MAQSVPPGDIQTQPNSKVVFNAPYDDKHTYHNNVRIPYPSACTVSTLPYSIAGDHKVLNPKEVAHIAVSCDAFAYGQKNTMQS